MSASRIRCATKRSASCAVNSDWNRLRHRRSYSSNAAADKSFAARRDDSTSAAISPLTTL